MWGMNCQRAILVPRLEIIMKEYMTISGIRGKAKDLMLGNYRLASGAFVLMLMVVYAISSIVWDAYKNNMTLLLTNSVNAQEMGMPFVKTLLINMLFSDFVSIVVNVFSDLMLVGFIYLIVEIFRNKQIKISDMFYAFKNHPDKVIIMSIIFSVCKILLLLPANLISSFNADEALFSLSPASLSWLALFVLGHICYIIFWLNCAMCYLIYIDDNELSAIECMKKSFYIMRGSVVRFFLMILSFAGYYILGMVSFGIGFMYVTPVIVMAIIVFYKDISDKEVFESIITEEIKEDDSQTNYWK